LIVTIRLPQDNFIATFPFAAVLPQPLCILAITSSPLSITT
jgi:hypothetical protein